MSKKQLIDDDAPALWERQPWDTPLSFAMFRDFYLPMDRYKRTVSGAYRSYLIKNNKEPNTKNGDPRQATTVWRFWSQGLNPRGRRPVGSIFENSVSWMDRAKAWDDEKDRQWERDWDERRRKLREDEYETADKLKKRADTMLAATLFRRTIESQDGKTVTIIEPTEWGEADIARLYDLAYKLSRRAAEMEQGRVKIVDWKSELLEAGIDPEAAYQNVVDLLAAEMSKTTDEA